MWRGRGGRIAQRDGGDRYLWRRSGEAGSLNDALEHKSAIDGDHDHADQGHEDPH
jgi:hypothetical protein